MRKSPRFRFAQPTPFKKRGVKLSGFTLIEILVALMIFAIMGVLAAMSLHSILRTHEALKKSDHELLQLQVTMTLLRRDLMQVVDRKPGFIGSGSDITFTRMGLANPFNLSRQSNMQQVSYELLGSQLVRLTWDALNQPEKIKPEAQVLLQGVQSLTWQFVEDNGDKSSSWPLTSTPAQALTSAKTPAAAQSPLPVAVLMVMHIKDEGVIDGVFPIPARGNYAPSQPPAPKK